ncbi:MAG TPA: hypothetical protein VK071_07670 [Tissierellales bacterium]|nr:hypothetical protein [Tissierellales bacterium]
MTIKSIRLGDYYNIRKGKKVIELEVKKEGSIPYIQIEHLRND